MIAGFYNSGMKGWLGKAAAKKAWSQLKDSPSFVKFNLSKTQSSRRLMLWDVVRKVIGKDTLNYAQQVGDCFVENTKVLMSNGEEKNIQDIVVGDEVISHLGNKRKVTNTIKKQFSGNLMTICVKGFPRPITGTEDHQFIKIPYKNHRYEHDNPEWTSLKFLSVKDRVLMPYGLQQNDENSLGLAAKILSKDICYTENTTVYCLEVENDHSFIANGFAVHNCVSFGAKNAIEYLICTEMLMKGDRETFKPIFPPYLYGTGRVFVGRGQINGDGSLGSWMADAVVQYGTIPSDVEGCPAYSGSIAREWGARPGPPTKFVEIGKNHLVKSAAKINSWDELVTAICNGYPCTVASNQGFNMEPSRDGFHAPSGTWAHQMCIIGIDDESSDPYAVILNSWGDAHSRLKDFETNEDLPIGVLRVRKRTIERMIDAEETFAYSNFDGFPDRQIEKELFKLI